MQITHYRKATTRQGRCDMSECKISGTAASNERYVTHRTHKHVHVRLTEAQRKIVRPRANCHWLGQTRRLGTDDILYDDL